MMEIPEPLKEIIHMYCHAEDYAISEIPSAKDNVYWKVDTNLALSQIDNVMNDPEKYIEQINALTLLELEGSQDSHL